MAMDTEPVAAGEPKTQEVGKEESMEGIEVVPVTGPSEQDAVEPAREEEEVVSDAPKASTAMQIEEVK